MAFMSPLTSVPPISLGAKSVYVYVLSLASVVLACVSCCQAALIVVALSALHAGTFEIYS